MKQENSEDGWWQFLTLCSKLKTANELQAFFELFLTIEERNDIANRLLIVKALLEGKQTQREIAHELQVSIVKITRGSNMLKTIGGKLRKYLMQNIK